MEKEFKVCNKKLRLDTYKDWNDLPGDIVVYIASFLCNVKDILHLFSFSRCTWIIYCTNELTHTYKQKIHELILMHLTKETFSRSVDAGPKSGISFSSKALERFSGFIQLIRTSNHEKEGLAILCEKTRLLMLSDECVINRSHFSNDIVSLILQTYGLNDIKNEVQYIEKAEQTFVPVYSERGTLKKRSVYSWSMLEFALYAQNKKAMELLCKIPWSTNDIHQWYIECAIKLLKPLPPPPPLSPEFLFKKISESNAFYCLFLEHIAFGKLYNTPNNHIMQLALFYLAVKTWIKMGIPELSSLIVPPSHILRCRPEHAAGIVNALTDDFANVDKDAEERYKEFMRIYCREFSIHQLAQQKRSLLQFDPEKF